MHTETQTQFETSPSPIRARSATGAARRLTRRSGATALTVALTVAVGLAFTAAMPTPVNAVECLLDDGTVGGATSNFVFDMACGTGANADGVVDGDGATAIGDTANAVGQGATSLGDDANAVGQGATALGGDNGTQADVGAQAMGIGATAIGSPAFATADGATALGGDADLDGFGAQATAVGATAIGADSVAAFDNSTALGAGAATTRANQVVLGTSSETYTLPGLSSAASSAAQSGPISVVTTDADGNLASDGGALFSGISGLKRDVRDNKEGIAMAMAMDAPYVPPASRFAMSGRYGNFEGSSAVSLSAAVRVSPNMQIDAGLGYGISHSNLGGTVGFTLDW